MKIGRKTCQHHINQWRPVSDVATTRLRYTRDRLTVPAFCDQHYFIVGYTGFASGKEKERCSRNSALSLFLLCRYSIGAFAQQDGRNGFEQNFNIFPQALLRDIL